MICHRHKCVFVHIPKVAGQSVEHVFLGWNNLTWKTRTPLLLRPNDDPTKGPPRLAHLRTEEYVKFGHLTPDQFASYYKFSFVRNPWNRTVSMYKYLRKPHQRSFKQFLQEEFVDKSWCDKHWFVRPQHEFICDPDGKLLVDFVGRYEQLQTDFNQVCKALGRPETLLPHVNKSRDGHGLPRKLTALIARFRTRPPKVPDGAVYDEESIELVRRLYGRDIELFGYEFGEAPPRSTPLAARASLVCYLASIGCGVIANLPEDCSALSVF
jgi:hypothetical protein